LIEPFTIASGRVDSTRAVEVEVRVTWRGRSAVGLGEAACLPPVTAEDQADVLRALESAPFGRAAPVDVHSLAVLGPVARAGVETALCDAAARIAGVPVCALLGDGHARSLTTDVTIPIGDPQHMAALAAQWGKRGFHVLKVKVGKDVDADVLALEAIGRAAPGATLRVDANAGYEARAAIAVGRACDRLGLTVECWEQPCAAEDLDGMEEVARALRAPVVADESVRTMDDLRILLKRRYAAGINLKLAKSGGMEACVALGEAAQGAGLRLMVGGMVETRLGMTAAAHVACALGGVDFVDLDTAWLLADDPYEGGYVADGPRYTIPEAPGLDVRRRGSRLC
jgi:L-alanine-DL-glutamate epimerase-like enolase superfamily enzyme